MDCDEIQISDEDLLELQAKTNNRLLKYPEHRQFTMRCMLASQLINDAAYSVAGMQPPIVVENLISMAADLERQARWKPRLATNT